MARSSDHVPFKLGTFSTEGRLAFGGVVLDGKVIRLPALASLGRGSLDPSSLRIDDEATLTGTDSVLDLLSDWDTNFQSLQKIVDRVAESDRARATLGDQLIPIEQLKVLLPAGLPRQVLCSGANYKKHVVDLMVDQGGGPTAALQSAAERRAAAEKMMDERAASGFPYMFTKLLSALTGPFDPIILPCGAQQPDWELELAAVIGRAARHVHRSSALQYVAGYTIANDVTLREQVFRTDIKALGTDWVASKCAPGSTPVGPYIVPAAFIDDPQDLRITLKLNSQVMQDESTADMLFDVARLVEYASAHVQLLPGDLLLTGSPAGNGSHFNRYLRPGDTLEGSITGLGTQRNLCVAEKV
jgi:2,4-diketo-3-deoxy-L-fuconate hydrolase